ncbi:MAG: SBBP repeat-containing protein, partial [Acidobacteriota bacterium]|nr:SBBP repeat-containing protein [Acidobacteriota bacterium]
MGANASAIVSGGEELPGKSNYFIGNDPKKWRTNVPNYAQVKYRGVYPGVDLVYYGNLGGLLEYDFVVAPGADPAAIRFELSGGREVGSGQPAVGSGSQGQAQRQSKIDPSGDLVVKTGSGEIRLHKPVVYQEAESDVRGPKSEVQDETRKSNNRQSAIDHRKFMEGRYVLEANNQVGFNVPSYDPTRPLVIDPALSYSTYLGGTGGDMAYAITVDTAGNAYVAGEASSTNFPVTPGAFQTTNPAGSAFVTKLNPTGTALVYSTYLGGSSGATASGLAVDTSGNVYVTGYTGAIDFPVTPGAFQTTNKAATNGNTNAFVTKLNPTGTALVYSTYLGGSGLSTGAPYYGDKGNAMAVDATGNVYVAGQAYSTDFPVPLGALQTANHGEAKGTFNAFITKLNAAGTALAYSTYLGGSGGRISYEGDLGSAIAVDLAGDAVVTGEAFSSDFPVTPGVFQTTNKAVANEGANAFVAKLNPSGTALVYSTYLGGSDADVGYAVAADSLGGYYVTGYTMSGDFPVANAIQSTWGQGVDIFIAKVTPSISGRAGLTYSTYMGDSNINVGYALAVRADGTLYVAGTTEG